MSNAAKRLAPASKVLLLQAPRFASSRCCNQRSDDRGDDEGHESHSVRGFLAAVVRKRLKLRLSSKKVDGNRVYQICVRSGRSAGGAAVLCIR
jgi:hypothetical protein